MTIPREQPEHLRRAPRSEPVQVGAWVIGGDQPILIQSMTTTDPSDLEGSTAQIEALLQAGCRLIRLAVPSRRAAQALARLRDHLAARGLSVALVADVHFDPQIALAAAPHVAKVRINPGNFASRPEQVGERLPVLLATLKRHATALRIGVNHGSLAPYIADLHGHGPEAMVASALEYLEVCRGHRFRRVVVSLKASNPAVMIAANRMLAQRMAAIGWRAPIHLGVTEAGEGREGALRSAVGIGTLLLDGIGDTIRVSLTGHPAHEIPVCREILAAVERLGGVGAARRDGNDPGGMGDAAGSIGGAPGNGPQPSPTHWRGLALGSAQPPRIELVDESAGEPAQEQFSADWQADRAGALPIESVVLAPPRIADQGAARALAERLEQTRLKLPPAAPLWLAVDRRQPFWRDLWRSVRSDPRGSVERASRRAPDRGQRAGGGPRPAVPPEGSPETQGFFSPRVLAAVDGFVLHVPDDGLSRALRSRDSARTPGDDGAQAWDPAAELPEEALHRLLAWLASRAADAAAEASATPILRWHLATPRAPSAAVAARIASSPAHRAAEAPGELLTAWARIARRLRDLTLAVGWPVPAFSWEGARLVAAGRALALALAIDGEPHRPPAVRPLLLPRLPADRWEAALALGSLLCDRLADGICLPPGGLEVSLDAALETTSEILQATRRRLSRAEFISCPGCGRLHFDLEATVRRLKQTLGHLPAVKIGVMGCAVNGPGEMADADFGYVGSGPQTVDLYVGRRRVQRGLSPEAADRALLAILREHGLIADEGQEGAAPS